MKKSEAQKILHNIAKSTEHDSIIERSAAFRNSPYPELDTYLWEFIYFKIDQREFEEKSIKLIQLSDTKLYGVLK